jgi:hypothetical protein
LKESCQPCAFFGAPLHVKKELVRLSPSSSLSLIGKWLEYASIHDTDCTLRVRLGNNDVKLIFLEKLVEEVIEGHTWNAHYEDFRLYLYFIHHVGIVPHEHSQQEPASMKNEYYLSPGRKTKEH